MLVPELLIPNCLATIRRPSQLSSYLWKRSIMAAVLWGRQTPGIVLKLMAAAVTL